MPDIAEQPGDGGVRQREVSSEAGVAVPEDARCHVTGQLRDAVDHPRPHAREPLCKTLTRTAAAIPDAFPCIRYFHLTRLAAVRQTQV